MSLYENQAQYCAEIYEQHGGFFAEPVGAGKTLMTALAPEVLKAHVARPLLFVPASLRGKTLEDYADLRKHWKIPLNYPLLTHETLQQPNNRSILFQFRPDLIVVDESQGIKNEDSTRGKRFYEYFSAHPECLLIILTGTPTDLSLMEYWRQIVTALKTNAPVPYLRRRAQEIADAIDAEVRFRRDPGALVELCDGTEKGGQLKRVREAFQKRLRDSWGVVISTKSSCDQPIHMKLRADIDLPPKIEKAIDIIRTTAETPNKDILENAFETGEIIRQLASGFFYMWDPPPPKPWLIARRAWRKFVREYLEENGGLDDPDSPALVARAHPENPLLLRWRNIKDVYDPEENRHAHWLSNYLIEEAIATVKAYDEPTLIWVRYREVGTRLAKMSGWEYLGGGPDAATRLREVARKGDQHLILSTTHQKGNNLQKWRRNLHWDIPQKPSRWEQRIGRTHRNGQTRPVENEVFAHVEELQDSIDRAIERAKYVYETTGLQQKIYLAKRRWQGKKKG